MTNSNIFAYRIDVIGLFEHPSTIEKSLRPANLVDFKWIPQTIGDQIWIFYQFATGKERNEYAKSFTKTDRVQQIDLTDEQIDHWL